MHLALAGHKSVLHPYLALDEYLDRMQEPQRALELAQMVLAGLQHYPEHEWTEAYAGELVQVSGNVALYHFKMKQYPEAEQYYQRAPLVQQQRQDTVEATRRRGSATALHQLGAVAKEQRQWQQAESYHQQALSIYAQYQDDYSATIEFRNLARLWQKSDNKQLPTEVTSITGMNVNEVEQAFRQVLDQEKSQSNASSTQGTET